MNAAELRRYAAYNREAFDRVLAPYVATKIANVARSLERGAQNAWLDASGCVWCLFDDPAFKRSGNEASALKETQGAGFDLQVFWSMGDVVMPHECDTKWVAKQIVNEAMRQLPKLGFCCRQQSRKVDGECHEGVLFARSVFRRR